MRSQKLVILGAMVVLAGLLKMLGVFEGGELWLFDRFWQIAPTEWVDQRIVIVSIGEEDLRFLGQYPPRDEQLAKMIEKIESQKPKVIGLDIYRDLKVSGSLAQIFSESSKLIGVGLHSKQNFPPLLRQREQVGDVTAYADSDGIVRRLPLYPLDDGSEEASTIPNFCLKLAYWYLKDQKGYYHGSEGNWVHYKGVKIPLLKENDGGYSHQYENERGYTMLIRWRKGHTFKKVSTKDLLENRVSPETFRDKIVLIGYFEAPSIADRHLTPIGELYGVEIQAHATSQILGLIEDGRSFFRFLPEGVEYGLIIVMIVLGSWQAKKFQAKTLVHPRQKILNTLGSLSILPLVFLISYGLFLKAWWIPALQMIIFYLLAWLIFSYLWYVYHLTKGLQEEVSQKMEKLATANQELEKALREIRQLEHQKLVQSKLSVLGLLASGISHELRNPLGRVRLKLDFLREQYKSNPPKDQRYVKAVNSSYDLVIRSLKTIDSIEAFSRQESPNPEKVDILKVVQDLLLEYAVICEPEKIKLETDLKYVGELSYGKTEWQRIISNLLNNSVEALKESSPEKVARIKVSLYSTKENICIEVADNGKGISKENLEKIREPFFSTKESTGLGLFFVEQIVQSWGGDLEIESQVGEKTKIRILLPIESEWD